MPTVHLPILADAIDMSTQVRWFADALLTPTGLAIAAIGFVVVSSLLVSRIGTEALGALCIFMLSMMRLESKYADNTLIQPLQSIREYSRPACLAIALAIAVRAIFLPRGERQRLLTAGCVTFFAFTLYYLAMLAFFADIPRAVLGALSVTAVLLAFVGGLGRLMQPGAGDYDYVRMFVWAGTLFVIANLAQLALGYSSAIIRGRMGGISGNPQQFAATCCVFAIIFAHLFSISPIGSPRKWAGAIALGILLLFVLWSGSRTGALCTIISMLAYFRTRIGRIALLGIVVAPVLLVLVNLFAESTWGTDRFLSGTDTRTGVWLQAIDGFLRSPVIGELATLGDDGVSHVESSYLRALTTMGIVGGGLLLVVVAAMLLGAYRAWRIGRARPDLSPLADLIIASTAFTLVSNAFEGFMFGLLTFFVVFTYALFAMTAYVIDAGGQDLDHLNAGEPAKPAIDAF
jgi:hypothetical protein